MSLKHEQLSKECSAIEVKQTAFDWFFFVIILVFHLNIGKGFRLIKSMSNSPKMICDQRNIRMNELTLQRIIRRFGLLLGKSRKFVEMIQFIDICKLVSNFH